MDLNHNIPGQSRLRYLYAMRVFNALFALDQAVGLEPTASCSRSTRATNCATPGSFTNHNVQEFLSPFHHQAIKGIQCSDKFRPIPSHLSG